MSAHLWRTFSKMSMQCERIDVVFDIYELGGIKHFERLRRGKLDAIEVFINHNDTPLPVEMDRFWESIGNKRRFEAFFIKWVTEIQMKDVTNMSRHIYLGGAHQDDTYKCTRIDSTTVADVPMLYCQHKKADDRLLLHIQHATSTKSFKRVIVASLDTDVFICLLYHFNETWKHQDLLELWVICGQGNTTRAVPIHDLVQAMPHSLVTVLPAVHSLSGCDTTSKVSTKHSAFKAAEQSGKDFLWDFGKLEFSSDMEMKAEHFLVSAIGGAKVDTLDKLRYHQYHHKGAKNNFEKLAPTSSSIKLHIKRAYLQCYQWINATNAAMVPLSPTNYGYSLHDDLLIPTIISGPTHPQNFPQPCTCVKCFRPNVCPCRMADIRCCEFCKCEASRLCRNPNNAD